MKKYYLSGLLLILSTSASTLNAGTAVMGIPGETVSGLIYGTTVESGAINVLYSNSDAELIHKGVAGFPGIQRDGDEMGVALANGDFNNDGCNDLAVGIRGNDESDRDLEFGAVAVLYGNKDGKLQTGNIQLWNQDSEGIPGEMEVYEAFGASIEVGDFNGDGYDDLAVGIPADRDTGPLNFYGSVNIIYGSPQGLQSLSPAAQLFNFDTPGILGIPVAGDAYGQALAAGDINGDGYDDLGIGAPRKSVGGRNQAGVVNVIYGSPVGLNVEPGTLVLEDQYLYQGAPNANEDYEAGDRFGWALTMGDYNNDGYSDLAVGVPDEDIDFDDGAGAVQIFWGSNAGLLADGNSDTVLYQGKRFSGIQDQSESGDSFGSSLATGDFNKDNFDDLVVGSFKESISHHGNGAVHVIYGSTTRFSISNTEFWHQDSTNVPGRNEENDYFGFSLAAGDINDDGFDDLLIGSYMEDLSGRENAGAVTFFNGSAGGLAPTKMVYQGADIPGSLETDDYFGYSLTILPKSRPRLQEPSPRFPWAMYLPVLIQKAIR